MIAPTITVNRENLIPVPSSDNVPVVNTHRHATNDFGAYPTLAFRYA